MNTLKLENEPKIKSGFTTPENYFENFSVSILQKLQKDEPKVISIFSKTKTWIIAAVAVLVLSLLIPRYINYISHSSDIDSASLENYITYNSSVSDADLVNLLDEKDIQKMNANLNIEEKNIEDELSTNKNLELYILN